VVAGARAAVAQASPVVKYELAKSALTAMGVPGPLAAVAAMGVSGYTGRGAKTTTATPAAAEAATVPGTGTAWTPGETPPINATYRVVRPPAGPEPPPPTTTGATPGPTPPMQTSYRVVEPPPPAAPPPARPQTATGTSWTPGAAPPAEPPPAPPAPVQSAPPPVQPAPAPAAPPAPVTPQAAQGALVMAAARAKIPLTKAELEAMVPHVVAGNTPDDVLAALVKLRQAPVASPAAEGAAARPAQVDVAGNVTPSRSRREMSATPGLTKSDVQDLGLNPDLPIKKLTPDLITRIMRNRAQRAALYRSDAAYKKSVDAMAASERD
jgi:hypothetical protein